MYRYISLIAISVLALAAFFTGCTGRQYAVVLWPNSQSEDLINDIVRVRNTNETAGNVTLFNPAGKRVQLEAWRVSLFTGREEAYDFLYKYQNYITTFARCERRALPVRESADRFSDSIYRLEDGEIIKVVQRADEPSDEAGFEDYWYEVITNTGERGWVFGYYLTILDTSKEELVDSGDTDRNITHILNNVWRPERFSEMLESGYVDIDTFSSEYGLFPAPLEGRITIQKPNVVIYFQYRTPIPLSENTFRFDDPQGAFPSLEITAIDRQSIRVGYTLGGRFVTERYFLLTDNITEIAKQVTAEKNSQLHEITFIGNNFSGGIAGDISISANGQFAWQLNGRTNSTLAIPANDINGVISFRLFLSPRLAQQYDGVLTLRYGADDNAQSLHYVYTLDNKRLALTPVTEGQIDGVVVTSVSAGTRPLVFSAARE